MHADIGAARAGSDVGEQRENLNPALGAFGHRRADRRMLRRDDPHGHAALGKRRELLRDLVGRSRAGAVEHEDAAKIGGFGDRLSQLSGEFIVECLAGVEEQETHPVFRQFLEQPPSDQPGRMVSDLDGGFVDALGSLGPDMRPPVQDAVHRGDADTRSLRNLLDGRPICQRLTSCLAHPDRNDRFSIKTIEDLSHGRY